MLRITEPWNDLGWEEPESSFHSNPSAMSRTPSTRPVQVLVSPKVMWRCRAKLHIAPGTRAPWLSPAGDNVATRMKEIGMHRACGEEQTALEESSPGHVAHGEM